MRTRCSAAALASAVVLGLTLTACSSSDDSGGDARAATAPPATTRAPVTATSAAPPPDYTVYRNSGGGADVGIADLYLPGATEATARAAIRDFVRKNGASVGYSVQVVRTKAAGQGFVCQGEWRKDAAAATAYGGKVGLTITCPHP